MIRFLLILVVLFSSCVEPIDFDAPPVSSQVVIEGYISDDPAPYQIKLSQALDLNSDSLSPMPIERAEVFLHSSKNESERLLETEPGIYHTQGVIRGEIGTSYYISIETADGRMFESSSEEIKPVGEVEEIRYEYEARTTDDGFGEIPADVFNIFIDANAGSDVDGYVRWRFTGIYKLVTAPELRMTETPPYVPYKDPPECSGYIVVEGIPGGKLEKVGECFCCECWVRKYEDSPQLSDDQFIEGTRFNNVKVGEVEINRKTFFGRYMVEVEQMSISREAFQFFKTIREQKESASSLFQPTFGEIRGNILPVNNNDIVIGMFWATSINKKSIFIPREAVPYTLAPPTMLTDDCRSFFPNTTTAVPEGWE